MQTYMSGGFKRSSSWLINKRICDILRGSYDMHGSLDPEENVMQDELISKRKAIAVCNQGVVEQLYDVIAKLGWDCYDDVSVEIGGTVCL